MNSDDNKSAKSPGYADQAGFGLQLIIPIAGMIAATHFQKKDKGANWGVFVQIGLALIGGLLVWNTSQMTISSTSELNDSLASQQMEYMSQQIADQSKEIEAQRENNDSRFGELFDKMSQISQSLVKFTSGSDRWTLEDHMDYASKNDSRMQSLEGSIESLRDESRRNKFEIEKIQDKVKEKAQER